MVASGITFAGESDMEIGLSVTSFPVSRSVKWPLAVTVVVSTTLFGRFKDKEVVCFWTITSVGEEVATIVAPLLKYAIMVFNPIAVESNVCVALKLPRASVAADCVPSPQSIRTLSPAPVVLPETSKLIPHFGFKEIGSMVTVAPQEIIQAVAVCEAKSAYTISPLATFNISSAGLVAADDNVALP